jgi:methylmalonyl-CoA mutase C-terminal domain/subunit
MLKKIRVLICKPGLDGHETGSKLVARVLRDSGMEVIYTGLRQTPEMIVETALQEDVDVIGLSILSGVHKEFASKVIELMKEKKVGDIPIIMGGIIPKEDIAELKAMGVKAVFGPGSNTQTIVEFIKKDLVQKQ